MNDDKHADRYVRITNHERFLIVRALSILENAWESVAFAYDGWNTIQSARDLFELRNTFCEENWLIGRGINSDKVKPTWEQGDER